MITQFHDADERGAPAASRHLRHPPIAVMVALAAIVALSLVAHLVGFQRDLPSPEADEPFFVLPAVQMATSGSLDPHWFGHPGSTVIVPLAILYRAREVVRHGAPVFGRAPSAAERFRQDPESFYLIGRAWTVLLGLASIVVLFALGRRLFGDVVALVAASCYALIPLVVNYDRMVRTDSAGACFALLALWSIVRMFDRPTTGRAAASGVAIGLAVASRWFLVVLGPVAVLALWWSRASLRRSRLQLLAIVALCCLGAFAIITPFFFLDWSAAEQSLRAETVGPIVNQSQGWFDSLTFYLFQALPDTLSWPAYLAAVGGVAWTVARREVRRLLLVGFIMVFLVVISASSLMWQRWIIPIVPVLLLFSAYAVFAGAERVARVFTSAREQSVRVTFVLVATVVLLAGPAIALVELDRSEGVASSRQLMRTWIVANVPRGTPIAEEVKGPELRSAGYPVLQRYDLPTDGTVADYAAHGYRYLVVNAYIALNYRLAARRFPEHAAFYVFLRRHAKLLHDERSDDGHSGPHLKLYRVDVAQFAVAHARSDHSTTQRSGRDLLRQPHPLYPVGDELLR